MSVAFIRVLDATEDDAELRATWQASNKACVTVERQSTQVPNTSNRSARGCFESAIFLIVAVIGSEILRSGSGVGDLKFGAKDPMTVLAILPAD